MKDTHGEHAGLDDPCGYVIQAVDGIGWEVIYYRYGVEVGGSFYAGRADAYIACKTHAKHWVEQGLTPMGPVGTSARQRP